MKFSNSPPQLSQLLATAGVNGGINGVISWFGFKQFDLVPLSVDSIAEPGITALGNAATVVFTLTFMFTSITFFIFRNAARKSGIAPPGLLTLHYWPDGLRMALSNTLLTFGGFVAFSVLWQRFIGTVEVGPLSATLIVASVAATATMIAEWRTKQEMLQAQKIA